MVVPEFFVLVRVVIMVLPRIIRDTRAMLKADRLASSEGGTKVTLHECEGIAARIGIDIGAALVQPFAAANGISQLADPIIDAIDAAVGGGTSAVAVAVAG